MAPTLFGLDRFGYAYVLPNAQRLVDEDPAMRVLAREALVRCPDGAIRLDRLEPREVVVAAANAPMPAPVSVRRSGRRLLVEHVESLADWQFDAPSHMPAEELCEAVAAAGLTGQGGGRFPVAAKWRSLARGGRVVVANAAEREPGTVKDQTLLATRPFAVIDGIVRTAAAVGADRAVIALDEDRVDQIAATGNAVAAARTAGLVGDLQIDVRAVPARYVSGEETALLAALGGGDPLPHMRPPHPTERGLSGRPTLVHNVETLVDIALISRHGATWFRAAGTDTEPGTGVFSVGAFGGPTTTIEVELGTTAADLLDAAGVVREGLSAVIIGGWSGGMLRPDQLDVRLTNRDLVALGAALGTKAITVVPDSRCPVAVAQQIATYFAAQSAGQCPSCLRGLPYVAESLTRLGGGQLSADELTEMQDFLRSLAGRGACALPDGVVRLVGSLFTNFDDLIDHHDGTPCARCKEDLG